MATEQEEKILSRLEQVTDKTRGGVYVLHFTDRRMIVEQVTGMITGAGCMLFILWIGVLIIGLGPLLRSLFIEMGSVIGAAIIGAIGGVGAVLAVAGGNKISLLLAKRKSAKTTGEQRTLEQILALHSGNYVIDYDKVQKVILKRTSMPMGHSGLKIESGEKKANLAFRRGQFDNVQSLLTKLLADKVEVK